MEDKTIVSVSYSNAVVPSFNSRGKPDLLAWDEAMDEHEDSEDTLAIFYDSDVLEACKPIIEEMYTDGAIRKRLCVFEFSQAAASQGRRQTHA